MNSYEMYLNHPAGDILTMEEALKIYTDIFAGVKECKIEDKDHIGNFACFVSYIVGINNR